MTRRGLVVGAAAVLVIFCVWLVRELRRPVEEPPAAQADQWITSPRGPALPPGAGDVLTSPSPRVAPLHAPPSRPGLPATMRLLPAQADQHAAPLPGSS